METKESDSENSRLPDESYDLQLFPLENEYIGVLNLTKLPLNTKVVRCETVIIVDRSGSMGGNVEYIINKVLPAFFNRLAYKPDDKIHLITFEGGVEYYKMTVKSLGSSQLRSGGSTYMGPAVTELHKLMDIFLKDGVESVRIFTISDGEIFDQPQTKQLSDKLATVLNSSKVLINSQACRFFTSASQPDTTALCCLLQLNNVTPTNLLDISSSEATEDIAIKWAKLFANDGLESAVELECDCPVFRRNPADTISTEKYLLTKGNNVFWVNAVPNVVKICETNVNILIWPPMTADQYQNILGEKMKMIVDHMKILKIIQTVGELRNYENLSLHNFIKPKLYFRR